MNIVRGRLKSFSNSFGSFLQVTRGYAIQKKLPINWIQAEKISCIDPKKSGDRGLEFDISPKDYIVGYSDSKELENAEENVKKLFTIEFNTRQNYTKLKERKILSLVKRHKYDIGSMETTIAHMTAKILNLQEQQKIHWRNKKQKVYLKELIEKRNRFLKCLRILDYARFEYLLKNLNIVYYPFPEENPRLFRKDCMRRLLRKYCDNFIQQKLDEYKAELESQHKTFFKEKAEKLEFIRNEEIACGVTPTITEEEIEAAKQKAASYT